MKGGLEVGFHFLYVIPLHLQQALPQGEHGGIGVRVLAQRLGHIDDAHGIALYHHAGKVGRAFVLDGLEIDHHIGGEFINGFLPF